jgi:hypothetical protein
MLKYSLGNGTPDGVGWSPTQKGGQQCRSHSRSAGSIGRRCRAEWSFSSTLRLTVSSRPPSGSGSTARPCASGGTARRLPERPVSSQGTRSAGRAGSPMQRCALSRKPGASSAGEPAVHASGSFGSTRSRWPAKTIARICVDLGLPRAQGAKAPRRAPRQLKLFEKATPGESVQVDVKVVTVNGTRAYQYTACGDCTRYRVLRLFPRLNTRTSVDFLAELRRVLPFSIQRVQTDHTAPSSPSTSCWPSSSAVSATGTSSRGARNRTGKWNAATASTMKSSGAAPPSAPLPSSARGSVGNPLISRGMSGTTSNSRFFLDCRWFSLFEDASGWYGSKTGADDLWVLTKSLPVPPRRGRVFPRVCSKREPDPPLAPGPLPACLGR